MEEPALWVIPDPTLLTKAGGGALIGHGADITSAGLKQLWSGQNIQTFTAQGLSKGLQSVGVPPYYAGMVSDLTEIGVAAMPVAIVAKVDIVGKVGVALYGAPGSTVANVAETGIVFRTWNEFQAGTIGQFANRAEAGAAWIAYRDAKGIASGIARSTTVRSEFLTGMGVSGKAPRYATRMDVS